MKALHFDPRTKLALILICVLSAMFAPDMRFRFMLVMLTAAFGAVCGRWRSALCGAAVYGLICLFTAWSMSVMTGTMRTMFAAFLGLMHKVYACGMMAGTVIFTTKVNEFLSAMNKLHCPQKLTIPIAVMLRYLPAVREDRRFIKDAMRLRDVSPSIIGFLRSPVMTVNCIYVPLLTAASKTADELSIASVTRGIENPQPRTCLTVIKMHLADYIAIMIFAAFFISGFFVRG